MSTTTTTETVPPLEGDALTDAAWGLAKLAHDGQTRSDGQTAYINHCIAVGQRALVGDRIGWCVRLLHDSAEPDATHPLTMADLYAARMPYEVVDGVDTLTRRAHESYEQFILRIKHHRDGKWIRAKVDDILSNLADEPTDGQIVKYSRALLTLLS